MFSSIDNVNIANVQSGMWWAVEKISNLFVCRDSIVEPELEEICIDAQCVQMTGPMLFPSGREIEYELKEVVCVPCSPMIVRQSPEAVYTLNGNNNQMAPPVCEKDVVTTNIELTPVLSEKDDEPDVCTPPPPERPVGSCNHVSPMIQYGIFRPICQACLGEMVSRINEGRKSSYRKSRQKHPFVPLTGEMLLELWWEEHDRQASLIVRGNPECAPRDDYQDTETGFSMTSLYESIDWFVEPCGGDNWEDCPQDYAFCWWNGRHRCRKSAQWHRKRNRFKETDLIDEGFKNHKLDAFVEKLQQLYPYADDYDSSDNEYEYGWWYYDDNPPG